MKLVKIGAKEKTEEDKLWELKVKFHSVLSCAFRLISDKYPEKFGEKVKGAILDEKTIELTGDLDIMKTEVYERVIESDGKKEIYSIILRRY